jgi:hypothetical protein
LNLVVGIAIVIPASLWVKILAETVNDRPFPVAHLIGIGVCIVLIASLVVQFAETRAESVARFLGRLLK